MREILSIAINQEDRRRPENSPVRHHPKCRDTCRVLAKLRTPSTVSLYGRASQVPGWVGDLRGGAFDCRRGMRWGVERQQGRRTGAHLARELNAEDQQGAGQEGEQVNEEEG